MAAANTKTQNLISSGMERIPDTAKQQVLRRWSSGIPHAVTDAIIIATPIKYPPMSVIGSDGAARGYLIDFWREWGRQVNREIQFRGSVWSETLQGIESGEADIHSGLFKNEKRETWLSFSQPFFVAETALFYKADKKNQPPLSQLAGKPVGVIHGSFQEDFLQKEYPSVQAKGYSDLDRMFIALFQDKIEAIIAEEPEVIGNLNRLGLSGAVRKGKILFQNNIYGGVLKEDKELLALVNRGINAIPEATKKELQERYFPSDFPMTRILFWAGAFLVLLAIIIAAGLIHNKRLNTLVKERTRSLKKSNEELRLFSLGIATSLDSVIMSDLTGHVTYINQATVTTFGFSEEETLGKRISMFGAEPKLVRNELFPSIKNHGNWAGEITGKRKDGSTFPLFNSTTLIIDEDKNEVAMLAIFRDLTENKKAETTRLQLEKKLADAGKMEAIGLMAGGVAHDLNNILSGVVTYPELLLMQLSPDDKLYKPIKAIQDSGKRAAAVVADLLTVARGVATVKMIASPNTLIDEYLGSAECNELQAQYPNVQIQSQLAADVWNILCSSIHIQKVLMNLITNAVESIEGDGRVVVSTRNQRVDPAETGASSIKAGEYVILTIVDTGTGITKHDQDHIFEPFYTKKVMGRSGTGLGLAIVWNTAQEHKAVVKVESNKSGTTFTLFFPACHDGATELPTNADVTSLMGKGTILVVDDEQRQREIASEMLTMLGYDVDTVASGEVAVAYCRKTAVDLVVLDMLMEPGMNGLQTFQRIIDFSPSQKAVIASGFAESKDVQDALALGVGSFIKKPYSINHLGEAVQKVLAK